MSQSAQTLEAEQEGTYAQGTEEEIHRNHAVIEARKAEATKVLEGPGAFMTANIKDSKTTKAQPKCILKIAKHPDSKYMFCLDLCTPLESVKCNLLLKAHKDKWQ